MREEQSTQIRNRSSTLLVKVVIAAFMFAEPLLASTDDLAGDWFLCGEDLQGNHTWEGSVVLSSDGSVTGGSINGSDGSTYSLVGGSLSIDGAGRVTGTIRDSDGITTKMTMHMDPAKGLIAGEGNALVGSEDGVFMLVRKATGFLAADLAGDWFLCGSDLQENSTWVGNVVLSSDGSVTGGSMNGLSFVGGSLSIDGTGRVIGTIEDSDGITTKMTMHMDPAKGLVAGEGNALVGSEDGVFMLVRKATGFLAADLAGDWFLCGEDLQGTHTWEGNVVLSSDGSVTGGGINGSDGPPTYSLVGGSLSIDGAGRVTGTIQDSDGITTQMTMHMDPGKGLVAGAGNAVGGDEDGVYVFVKMAHHRLAAIVRIAIDQPGQRVELSIADLYPGNIYTIQRSLTLQSDDWLDLRTFEASDTEKTLFESLDPDWGKAFWRVKQN